MSLKISWSVACLVLLSADVSIASDLPVGESTFFIQEDHLSSDASAASGVVVNVEGLLSQDSSLNVTSAGVNVPFGSDDEYLSQEAPALNSVSVDLTDLYNRVETIVPESELIEVITQGVQHRFDDEWIALSDGTSVLGGEFDEYLAVVKSECLTGEAMQVAEMPGESVDELFFSAQGVSVDVPEQVAEPVSSIPFEGVGIDLTELNKQVELSANADVESGFPVIIAKGAQEEFITSVRQ